MALALKYRPKKMDEVYGNSTIKKSLTALLKRNQKDIPKCFAFFGGSGCGKTTFARIVANELGCSENEFYELNAASVRGIDTIRDIEKQVRYAPMSGSCRIWLLDECFAKGTLIKSPNGDIPIEDVKIGDSIFSLCGDDVVTNKFENKVNLNRIMKLTCNTGVTYCSTEHEILTTEGWKYAKDLQKNDCILPYISILMNNDNILMGVKNDNQDLSLLQERISNEKTTQSLLQQSLFCTESTKTIFREENVNVYLVSERNDSSQKSNEIILFKKLSEFLQMVSRWIQGKDSFGFSKSKKKKELLRVLQNRSWLKTCKKIFGKNEEKQSISQSNNCRKGYEYSAYKWVATYLEWFARGQWSLNYTTNNVSSSFGLCMAVGISDFSGKETCRFSNKLQSGFSESKIDVSDRSGWKIPSIENQYYERYKETNEIGRIRVERVEIYQRGNNDESFRGIIDDTEKNKGYVIFYDMEMKNHHSYFANDMTVHNCHQYPAASQEALLKMFEECPSHAYFMICTTNPEKLKPALKNRCISFEVTALTNDEMTDMLWDVVENEEKAVPEPIIDNIVKAAGGSSRNALQMLEKIIDLEPKEMKKVSLTIEDTETVVKDLIQALLKKDKWAVVASILNRLNAEPETVRHATMGYCTAILLNGKDNAQAALILEYFKDNWYDSGKAGMAHACYSIVCG
jgi:DNA polymerase III gamma/tau subunit